MRFFLAALLVLTGCTASIDLDASAGSANGVSGSTSALDRRAASNLVAHRDGADGVFGTRDDDLFDTLAEVDAVRWVGLAPPTGQEPITLWDGATMTGPLPTHFVDRAIYRDDQVNGSYRVLIQNIGGRGEGTVGEMRLTISSRWD